MEPQNKKKHPVLKAMLITFIGLILLIGIIAFINFDNIVRLYKGMTYSAEDISSLQAENDKKTNELLNELAVVTMRDLTDEERALLASGELSESDALSLIQGLMPPLNIVITSAPITEPTPNEPQDTAASKVTSDSPVTSNPEPLPLETVTEKPQSQPAVTTVTTTTTTQANPKNEPLSPEEAAKLQNRISEIIAEIYLLRATYLNKIDDLIATTKAEYIELPREKRTLQVKMQFVEKKIIPKGKALEAECDASMNKLLTELSSILTRLELKSSIVDEIKVAYKEQKDLKMAELYGKYSSRLK